MTKTDFESSREFIARVYGPYRDDIFDFFVRMPNTGSTPEELTQLVYETLEVSRFLEKVADPREYISLIAMDVLFRGLLHAIIKDGAEPGGSVVNKKLSGGFGSANAEIDHGVALAQLNPVSRRVFYLRKVMRMSPAQIADETGHSLKRVNEALTDALTHLHAIYGDVLRRKR